LPDLQSSPIIGHGLSSVLWSHAAKTNPFFMTNSIGHTHSAYIGLLLDFGILGIFVFILFYCHLWRLFRQVSQLHSDPVWRAFFKGALGCIVLLLVQGVTDDRFVPTIPQTYLWLAYGMALGFAARIPRPTLSTVYAYTKVA
jgi:hypothetical protein